MNAHTRAHATHICMYVCMYVGKQQFNRTRYSMAQLQTC